MSCPGENQDITRLSEAKMLFCKSREMFFICNCFDTTAMTDIKELHKAGKKVFVCMFKYALSRNIADTDELQNVYKMRKYQNFAGAKELQGSCFP